MVISESSFDIAAERREADKRHHGKQAIWAGPGKQGGAM